MYLHLTAGRLYHSNGSQYHFIKCRSSNFLLSISVCSKCNASSHTLSRWSMLPLGSTLKKSTSLLCLTSSLMRLILLMGILKTHDISIPLGKFVSITHYVDANLHHYLITGRSVTGILHLTKKIHSWLASTPRSGQLWRQPPMVHCSMHLCGSIHGSQEYSALLGSYCLQEGWHVWWQVSGWQFFSLTCQAPQAIQSTVFPSSKGSHCNSHHWILSYWW